MTEATLHRDRVDGYASALIGVARAEGGAEEFVDTFYSAAKTISANTELRDTLVDPAIPVAIKQGIVTDLLAARVDKAVVASINFIIASGLAKFLDEVASRLAELVAEREGTVVAEVKSAVSLDADQVARLEAALSRATGKRVQAKVSMDPSIMGGLVATIGDTVFDGSVRSRLDDVRERWG
ncbi:MAG TPA: ATP synthase F1 subunit delta [Acidimicrobiia bacterium]|nr:ATP synthase F1 subunit delta [Acidimicrobiia bacterium]